MDWSEGQIRALQLVAGACSGVVTKSFIAPLERIKILFQIQGSITTTATTTTANTTTATTTTANIILTITSTFVTTTTVLLIFSNI